MLALIAGTGALPPALVARLSQRPLVCALDGFVPDIAVDITFRLENLGTLLQTLAEKDVTQICMAGAIRRPTIDPSMIDAATLPLVPKVQAAMAQGDDGALRVIIALFEGAGFSVVAAHEIAPDLLPSGGILSSSQPDAQHCADVQLAEACIAEMGDRDVGQACLVRDGQIIEREGVAGTDAMLAMASDAKGAVLFKAPKPNQDRRADLPLVGPATATRAVQTGLAGIIVEAGGVMVLDIDQVTRFLNDAGLFFWVRPRGGS